MPDLGDNDLFDRSVATLIESWTYLASGSPGADVIEADGVAVATFVAHPEREYLNNAVLARGCARGDDALESIERIYAARGIDRYAVWVHGADRPAAAAVRARGYDFDSSTLTMAMPIDEFQPVDTAELEVLAPDLGEFWRVAGAEGLVPDLSAERGHFYVARLGGEGVATLMAFDHDGDCGIYMVGTVPAARRKGLATALSAHAVREAIERGCTTISLQATEMAEGVYARVGLRDLGRFDEYVPTRRSPGEPPDREETKQ